MTNKVDLLDNDEIDNHRIDYTFKHGPNFGAPARLAASIFAAFFWYILFIAILNGVWIGIFIALLFLIPLMFVITAHTGVVLSVHSKYFKEYSSYMGVKYGKWKTFRGLTDVAILTIRTTKRVSSTFGGGAIDIKDKQTGVYFLIPSHRKRVLINVSKTKNEAEILGRELAEKLDKTFNIFNPQVSEASKSRRYR